MTHAATSGGSGGSDGSWVRTLFPGYFALVMATGIIAIACEQQDLEALAKSLYWLAAIGYVVLTVALVARIVKYPRDVIEDATHHVKGFAFLTTVAGTNVLGAASGLVMEWWDLARGLWWVSIPLWVLWLYTALIADVVRRDKPDLREGINGTWFMLTVSTESIAVLGALLVAKQPGDLMAVGLLAMFLLGIVLYLIVMTMVFLRWSFRALDPTEMDPPAWIAAGAVAITTLAGSNLVAASSTNPRLERVLPVIEVLTLMAWATASFWLPLMVAIGIWRHVVNRVPLTYQPSYWSLVFPIGMYAAASDRMFDVLAIDGLSWVPKLVLGLALIAWTATAAGLVHHLVRGAVGQMGMR